MVAETRLIQNWENTGAGGVRRRKPDTTAAIAGRENGSRRAIRGAAYQSEPALTWTSSMVMARPASLTRKPASSAISSGWTSARCGFDAA